MLVLCALAHIRQRLRASWLKAVFITPLCRVCLTNPIVKSAADATFTPQFVQKNTEQVLDGTYDWLDGKTPVPDFQIDLTSTKIAFANNVAAAVQKQLAGLPVCTAAQTQALAANFDALSATCLPKGITAESAASTVQSNILT